MLSHAIPAVLIALAAPLAVAADPVQDLDGVEVAQLSIHQRIVIRVPRLALQPAPRAAPIRWKEKHGPHCIAAASLAGALVSGPNAVDLVLTGGQRLRARLDGDCAPLDFYPGFYIKPAADGKICADRDVIRARSGAACQIDKFRILQPAR
jgi:hypothetical protein